MDVHQRLGETGNSRIVRDRIAELHQLIQNWNAQIRSGSEVIDKINNCDLNKRNNFNSRLHELCEQLRLNIYQMEKIVQNMQVIVNNLKAVTKLQTVDGILFKTWPVKKFGDSTEEILNAYKHELSLKILIAESIAHQENETQGIALQATWLYEPNISSNNKIFLEAMLLEAGLRKR